MRSKISRPDPMPGLYSTRLLMALCSLCLTGNACLAQSPQKTPVRDTRSQKTHHHHLASPGNLNVAFKKMSVEKLSFACPGTWKKKETESKEELVKLGGDIAGGAAGEMTVSHHKDESIKAEDLKLLIEQFYLKKLEGVKPVQEKQITFGRSRQLKGILKDVYLPINDTPFFQRLIFFDGPDGGAYSISFISQKSQLKKLAPVFNKVLLSLAFDGSGKPSPAAAQGSRTRTANIKARHVPVSLSYPDGWQVSQATGDNPLNITGKNKEGKPATISIYKGPMHPWWTIDDVANTLEKEHMSPRDKYRRLNRSSRSFGSLSKINGIIQESQFEENDKKVKQLVAFFNDGTSAYVLSMTSTGWKPSDMRQTFHKLLASLRLENMNK